MAAINTTRIRSLLEPGLNALFGDTYKTFPQQWSEIFDQETSEKNKETEVRLSMFGLAAEKSEGDSTAYDEMGERWTATYVHKTISLGYLITKEAVEDNLYMSNSKRQTKALARSFAITKEVYGANILNNGFDTNYPIGDAAALLSTSHPTDVGNQANKPSTAVDLNEASLEDALVAIDGFQDDRGLPIMVSAKKLIIPRQLQFVARRLLESSGRVDTANNDINTLKGILSTTENIFLTDTDAWFIKTDAPDGLKHFKRTSMETGMYGDFDTDNVKFKGRERYSFGVSDWRAIYGSAGA